MALTGIMQQLLQKRFAHVILILGTISLMLHSNSILELDHTTTGQVTTRGVHILINKTLTIPVSSEATRGNAAGEQTADTFSNKISDNSSFTTTCKCTSSAKTSERVSNTTDDKSIDTTRNTTFNRLSITKNDKTSSVARKPTNDNVGDAGNTFSNVTKDTAGNGGDRIGTEIKPKRVIQSKKMNIRRIYSSKSDLFKKSLHFNREILKQIQKDVTKSLNKTCDSVHIDLTQRHKLLRGYIPLNWARLLGNVSLIGTKKWMDEHGYGRKEFTALTRDMITKYNISVSELPKYYLFNFRTPTTGVKTFILSSLKNAKSVYVNVTTRTENYYNCYESKRLKNIGGWTKQSGGMFPALCHNECSTNISVLNTPVALPDFGLHTDYTRSWFLSTCQQHNLPFAHSDEVSMRILHNKDTADILQALDVVYVGGIVLDAGHVLTSQNEGFDLHHCEDRKPYILSKYNKTIINNTSITCTDEIFVISDYSPYNFGHFVHDQLLRLSGYVPLLQRRSNIAIHVGAAGVKFLNILMKPFGLKNRVLSGSVRAKVIYIPHSGGCHNPNFVYAELTNTYFNKYTEDNRKLGIPVKDQSVYSRRHFVLIKRTKRRIVNHNDVYNRMVKLGTKTNRKVVVFDDKELPTFNETLDIFNRADLIVGPHGAGFGNLMASTPGATIMEVHCRNTSYVRMPFRLLTLRLGMRYFGTQTTRPNATSERCNTEGLRVDLTEFDLFLKTVSTYLPKA